MGTTNSGLEEYHFRQKGLVPDQWYWADLELWSRNDFRVDWDCSCDRTVGENCEYCNPVGVPKWLVVKKRMTNIYLEKKDD